MLTTDAHLPAPVTAPTPGGTAANGPTAADAALEGRALRRAALPGRVRASASMPWVERAAFVVVVPLLSVPVLLVTMGAAWALGLALLLTAGVALLCSARRVLVGDEWFADRRLWRYRVTHGSQLRAVHLVDTAHGGVLRLAPHAGRAHRLRRAELHQPGMGTAVAAVLAHGTPVIGAGVDRALSVPPPAAGPRGPLVDRAA